MSIANQKESDSLTIEEALARSNVEIWKKATAEELESFEDNCACEIADWSENCTANCEVNIQKKNRL